MQLTVLGNRSGMPSDGEPSSGYLVGAGSTSVLLDCGPGIATALSSVTESTALDAVVISHLHADHCYDLLPLGKALLHARAHRVMAERDCGPYEALRALDVGAPGVPLYVPAGGRSVLDRLAALFPVGTFPALDRAFEIAFEVREYRPGDAFEVGDCALTLHPGRHAIPNCGVRIDAGAVPGGGSLAYTGDTGLTDGLRGLCDGVDLLVAEATLDTTDTGTHGHLSGADAGTVAADNRVGELVLTHFATGDPAVRDRRRAAAAAVYDGPVRLAAPGHRYQVAPRSGVDQPVAVTTSSRRPERCIGSDAP